MFNSQFQYSQSIHISWRNDILKKLMSSHKLPGESRSGLLTQNFDCGLMF